MKKLIAIILVVILCIAFIGFINDARNNKPEELISPVPTPTYEPRPTQKQEYFTYKTDAIHELLGEFESPLTEKSESFVDCADENNISPYLLVGISKVESTFGKNTCEGNPFGWSSCRNHFSTFELACQAVSKGIATLPYYEEYRNSGKTKDLGETYCPSSSGCNTEHWIETVDSVITDLEERELVFALKELATLTPHQKSAQELKINTQVLKSHAQKATGATLEVIEILIRANERALQQTKHES
ncbi:MAG TPA: hypothetical protein PKJ68_03900 [Candidatus Woesebacteria bacterium]|jgi:hypothetical protein|nr:hypothetical protein [Candidatus Woesebacteria bacterium]